MWTYLAQKVTYFGFPSGLVIQLKNELGNRAIFVIFASALQKYLLEMLSLHSSS